MNNFDGIENGGGWLGPFKLSSEDRLRETLDLIEVFWRLRNITRSVLFFNVYLSKNSLFAAIAICRLSMTGYLCWWADLHSFFRALASFAFNLNIDWELTGERKTVSLFYHSLSMSHDESTLWIKINVASLHTVESNTQYLFIWLVVSIYFGVKPLINETVQYRGLSSFVCSCHALPLPSKTPLQELFCLEVFSSECSSKPVKWEVWQSSLFQTLGQWGRSKNRAGD